MTASLYTRSAQQRRQPRLGWRVADFHLRATHEIVRNAELTAHAKPLT
jgi:hypothetical protein